MKVEMGDRGNIYFVDREVGSQQWGGMYLYTHWGGSALPQIVQAGLKRGDGRWGDSQYLARILFCELIRDDVLGETGYGLGTHIGDNGHLIVRVNDLDGTVAYCEPGTETDQSAAPVRSWTYAEFVAADANDGWDGY